MLERIGVAGMKILRALALKENHRAESLKELSRIAKVGMSQIYSKLRILEKLELVKVEESFNPYRVHIQITEEGLDVAEDIIRLETKLATIVRKKLQKT